MKDIKFRSWVEHEDKISGKNNYSYMENNPSFNGSINEIFSTSGKEPLNIYGCKITYMQFTNIKDDFEKEIYEGDIVELVLNAYCSNETTEEWEDEKTYIGEVVWDNGYHVKTKGYSPSLTHYHKKSLKILGDKFQNPELLK